MPGLNSLLGGDLRRGSGIYSVEPVLACVMEDKNYSRKALFRDMSDLFRMRYTVMARIMSP